MLKQKDGERQPPARDEGRGERGHLSEGRPGRGAEHRVTSTGMSPPACGGHESMAPLTLPALREQPGARRMDSSPSGSPGRPCPSGSSHSLPPPQNHRQLLPVWTDPVVMA